MDASVRYDFNYAIEKQPDEEMKTRETRKKNNFLMNWMKVKWKNKLKAFHKLYCWGSSIAAATI